ncbi:MAG: 50S ribosomal protein L35 [Candidatus Omnitrophica bacterium]|nr:50S ribosomal protein L35 [Candidatus Omnitrophota bacterium]MCM8830762.1 50S ribosomal protein L35 [Candidatus Omnitrophota bacterium]
MMKLKTKKSLAKRVKVTKNKKVLRWKACRRHLLSYKSKKRKRFLGKKTVVSKAEKQMVKKALPYAF